MYKIYAGYYELYVSKENLPLPLMWQCNKRKISCVIDHCERAEVSYYFDSELEQEVSDYYLNNGYQVEDGQEPYKLFNRKDLSLCK